jgi:hypothetical protein
MMRPVACGRMTDYSEVNCCNQMWVLKKYIDKTFFPAANVRCRSRSSLSSIGGNFQNGVGGLAEEPHHAFEVLRSRGQEELLSHELQPPQAQATQSDLILQFGEQRFHLLSLALRTGKLGRVR